MSASMRPISASPRSSVKVLVTLPASPMSDKRGPPVARSTDIANSGAIRMLIDTRWPTRLPHRAQKTSTPSWYSAPQEPQVPAWVSPSALAPQNPQNGSDASVVRAQRGQVLPEGKGWPPTPGTEAVADAYAG